MSIRTARADAESGEPEPNVCRALATAFPSASRTPADRSCGAYSDRRLAATREGWPSRYRRGVPDRRATSTPPRPPRCTRSPAQALLAALDDGWADPRRLYGAGRRARLLLDAARESVAESPRRPRRTRSASPRPASPPCTRPCSAPCAATAGPGRRSSTARSSTRRCSRRPGRTSPPAAARSSVGVDRTAGSTSTRSSPPPPAPDVAAAALQAANHEVGTLQPVDADRRAWIGRPADRRCHPRGRARSRCRPAGRCWPPTPGPGAARPASAILAVRTGTRWTLALPGRRRRPIPGCPARPTCPAIVAAAASLRAVLAERDAEARPAARADRADPRHGRRVRPRCRAARRSRRPAAAPRRVLVPLRRRRGAARPRSTGSASPSRPARRAPRRRSSPRTSWSRWAP